MKLLRDVLRPFYDLLQRFNDYAREERIKEHARAYLAAVRRHACKHVLQGRWNAMVAEIDARSPGQRRRAAREFVRRLDPHARAVHDRIAQA